MVILFLSLLIKVVLADDDEPIITGWKKADGTTGYDGIVANIKQIDHSTNYIYIKGAGIPSYDIGPWKNNNTASDLSFVYKFPRNPTNKTTKQQTTLRIGVWINGVGAYSTDDKASYDNKGVWKENAYYYSTFDSCEGHANNKGEYHHHASPLCLYNSTDSTKHSPLIGFAFDGFPIYGPFGYSTALDATSSIKRILPSYRHRDITVRQTLSNGTELSSYYYGPDVNSTYPLGRYNQDYEYVSGLGDLDEYNGRYCKTPEYPNGTYAYFVGTDSTGTTAYPFIVGPSFFGVPITNQQLIVQTISETVTNYFTYSG